MNRLFADTSYFIALFQHHDFAHVRAVQFTAQNQRRLVTSEWIICEIGNFVSRSDLRPLLQALIGEIKLTCEIVHASHASFSSGLDLFLQRPDKNWSLTDCISFVIMQEKGISEALTTDHHFEQAGFAALLK
ncbi:MAG: type II toxin-antitoxin system VapC family toxin [Phycisphaerae bacterium]|nr:type II toxin-antitoxin system VapC family toxin [Phycisphaerae bacterium]